MLRLYNLLAFPLRGVAWLWSRMRSQTPERAREWAERRARLAPEIEPGGLWLHGASVGEARLVTVLADALRNRRPALPLAASCQTPTGRGQLPSPPRVDAAFFVPLDFRGYPGRILDATRPSALVLVETELWPNLVTEASERAVAVAMVNARLAPERMGRYRRLRRLYEPVLRRVAALGAQSADDAERFAALGVRPEAMVVTGNIKYDLPPPRVSRESLLERFGLSRRRPVVVAGSTGAGEDAPVLDAFVRARRDHPDLFLVLAPRHPERAADAAGEANSRGLTHHLLSTGDDRAASSADVLVVDTVGELAALYGLAHVAFVGGSLVPVGGHNVLEPAAAGVPVAFGPYTHHFAEPVEALLRSGGGIRVRDGGELASVWIEMVGDAQRAETVARNAAAVIEQSRGALERSIDLVLGLVDRGSREGATRA
jgi:3-deoxy-D-manno-octulosonic-acid transferase